MSTTAASLPSFDEMSYLQIESLIEDIDAQLANVPENVEVSISSIEETLNSQLHANLSYHSIDPGVIPKLNQLDATIQMIRANPSSIPGFDEEILSRLQNDRVSWIAVGQYIYSNRSAEEV